MATAGSAKRPKSRQPFAKVSWCAEDIKTLRPNWSVKRCTEFLDDNENHIQCAMIERGWEAIRDLIRWEDYK